MATPSPTPYDSQTTLQKMWNTRPRRIPQDQGGNAMIAGVCEGIGARYRLDPVLVRLIFVALSLVFGGGVFVYLLCWLCMPRYGMKVSPGRAIATPKAQLAPIERTWIWIPIGVAAALLTGAALFATTDHSDDNPGGADPDATVDATAFAG